MCAVFSKQTRWDRVLFYAKKAHELDENNTKAKFRMGQAYLQLDDIEKAKELLEEVQATNPDGKNLLYRK
jgi:FimV-like protein